MNRWYRVEIRGRANGWPREVKATLQAEDATWAAYNAVGAEWPGMDLDHDYVRGPGPEVRRVVRFRMESGDESRVFVTEHESFDEMATEVGGAAEVAVLDGHPRLPGLEAEDGR